MHITLNWPNAADLPIPEDVCAELFKHLLEAFPSEEDARQYWNEIPTLLIILNADDSYEAVSHESDEFQNQLNFVLTYPEFVIPVGAHYHLALAIFTDEGSGIYLLAHHDCPITKDLSHA